MLDYIQADTFVGEDKPFLDNLDYQYSKYGYHYFYVNGCNKMKVRYNETNGHLELS